MLARTQLLAVLLLGCSLGLLPAADDKTAAPLQFKMQEIEKSLGVGYAVTLVDVNGDKKLDIVVVDTTRVVWYENPTWKRRIIIENQTKPDNVCIAAHDIDGDGQIDFALGADWRPFNTKTGGTIQWLQRGKSLDEKWTVHPIGEEPTVHRMRFAPIDGRGKTSLIVGPLMGRNSTKEKNWMDGEPVRLVAYRIPTNPARDRWTSEVLDQSVHVMHNFWPFHAPHSDGTANFLLASYDGVSLLTPGEAKWQRTLLGTGNQENLAGNRGASEIKRGNLASGPFIATVEPWHGHQIVVYSAPGQPKKLWDRHVLDDRLKWGHAVWCADLDGDGGDELIIGVRDNLSMKPGERCGVRIYKPRDPKWAKWDRQLVDEGGVAVEDLAAADLDGDGKIDLVAVGRATHNVRIYWNQGRK